MDVADALWIVFKLVLGLVSMMTCIAITRGYSTPGSAIELVQNFVFGGIIGGVIYSPDVTLIAYLLALMTWTALIFLVKLGAAKVKAINRFAFGRDWVIYRDGAFDTRNLLRTKTPLSKVVEDIVRSGTDLDQISTISVTSAGAIEITSIAEATPVLLTDSTDLPADLTIDRELLAAKMRSAEISFLLKDELFFVPKVDQARTPITFLKEKEFRALTLDFGHADSSMVLGKRGSRGWLGRTTRMSSGSGLSICSSPRRARR